jgi:hypothetical protein
VENAETECEFLAKRELSLRKELRPEVILEFY